ncbi:Uu.00g117330.m01.CDS01 [Anthostomella pinea]|uniref:Uu.00g117330.m01.CDS01 n=1 Tax=Anthostomella pinea TaxID=933095 RepID=A0AAI8VG61_9PEZI|nr:Uu.00g117330.m01.CDS01 [Anthostomella pinea]
MQYNDQNRDVLKAPRYEILALILALTISSILATYRGARAFPSAITVHKRLSQLLNGSGVFEQQRIDAENPLDPISQEQYQRVSLILFKTLVHLNALLITHLSMWPLFHYLDPAALDVRIPSSQIIWDSITDGKQQESDYGNLTVGSLFVGETSSPTYQALTSLAAWDFSTGMILGCFVNRQPGESLSQTMHRAAAKRHVLNEFMTYNFRGGGIVGMDTFNFVGLRMIFDEPMECRSAESKASAEGIQHDRDYEFMCETQFHSNGSDETFNTM